jgi:hypothetical protein
MGTTCGPAATWQPHHRNHLAKPPDGQKMNGFKSSRAKDFRFSRSIVKIKLLQ